MKKLLGFIAIVAVVFTLTMTVNTSNEKTQSTSDLIAYNIADAAVAVDDIRPVSGCRYTGSFSDRCTKIGLTVINCVNSIFTSCGIITFDSELSVN